MISDLKLFALNGMLAEEAISDLVEKGLPLREGIATFQRTDLAELNFVPTLVAESEKMAEVFRAFYCIENSARLLIVDRMAEKYGSDWWEEVPTRIKTKVSTMQTNEAEHRYRAERSGDNISYTFFGSLKDIIVARWDDFSDLFPDQHWVSSRFNDLESARNIVMHTCMLPDEEIARVHTIARDWIRQVE